MIMFTEHRISGFRCGPPPIEPPSLKAVLCAAAVVAALIFTVHKARAADLLPDALAVEATHVSHITQHAPFTSTPTNYGYNTIGATLRWQRGRFTLAVGDSLILEACSNGFCGCLAGPRETFTARVSYDIWLRR